MCSNISNDDLSNVCQLTYNNYKKLFVFQS